MVVVDAQTFLIPRFSYDGQAPDAHFWVGQGKPGPEGNFVADENGSSEPLRSYKEKTLVIEVDLVWILDGFVLQKKTITTDHEQEEEAEEREKEGEGQTAKAGEEEVEGGVSSPPSPHRAALPYPATATWFAIRMVLPNYPAAGRLRIHCQEQQQMSP